MESLSTLRTHLVAAWDTTQTAYGQFLTNPTIETLRVWKGARDAYATVASEWDQRILIVAQVGE